jgi:hypothetical protein
MVNKLQKWFSYTGIPIFFGIFEASYISKNRIELQISTLINTVFKKNDGSEINAKIWLIVSLKCLCIFMNILVLRKRNFATYLSSHDDFQPE